MMATIPETLNTKVCIVGGGPAGMMLGLLFSKVGIDTIVLEKHADFLRDFRGDTVHPSTLEIFNDLGLFDQFLQRPHQKADRVSVVIGGEEVPVADLSHLPTRARFIAFMPQWDFLDFVRDVATQSPAFHLELETSFTDLLVEGGRVVGVKAKRRGQDVEIRSELVVGADGRHSAVREKAELPLRDLGAPIDALWLRLSRRSEDPEQLFGRVDRGRFFVMLNRGDYWQCAFVIPKNSFEHLKERGLDAFRKTLVALAPFLRTRVNEIDSWDEVRLLNIRVDRLEEWAREGLLCIGDAAHAMSPVGGVGINLAIQDAVCAANLLSTPLRENRLRLSDLRKVQARREFPTRVTQAAQVQIHRRVLSPILSKGDRPLRLPILIKLARHLSWLRRIPARLVGIGIRPEHPDPRLFRPFLF